MSIALAAVLGAATGWFFIGPALTGDTPADAWRLLVRKLRG